MDTQPAAGPGSTPEYANYVYGVYTASAGIPLQVALFGANRYAGGGSGDGAADYGTALRNRDYPNMLPDRVATIKQGYADVSSGTVCKVPNVGSGR